MLKGVLTWGMVVLGVLVFGSGSSWAIQGVCSNCHTMHYSQDGGTPPGAAEGGPFPYLLLGSCVGCHSAESGTTKTVGTPPNQSIIPVVYTTSDPGGQGPGNTLAGGNFYWVTAQGYGDAYGHNVEGIADEDGTLHNEPPGWDPDYTNGFSWGQVAEGASSWGTNRLTCAGVYGCHGRHTSEGVKGAHHSNQGGDASSDSYGVVDGLDIGSSYRFLAGIEGGEDGDWEDTADYGEHNEYKGANITSNRNVSDPSGPPSDTSTISFLCAECHGLFHSHIDDDDTAGPPYLRHPTDVVLPSDGEYADYTTYSIEAPVARQTIPSTSPSSTVSPGTDVVMCLSCHRAHGSPYPDILRWDYSKMVAGGGGSGGCFTCHTQKN